MHFHHPFHGLFLIFGNGTFVVNANLGDLNRAVDFLDVPFDRGFQFSRVQFDTTRCQRAGKGARQSPADSRDDVIEGGRVLRLWSDPVEIGDCCVDAVIGGLFEMLDISVPDGPLKLLTAYL